MAQFPNETLNLKYGHHSVSLPSNLPFHYTILKPPHHLKPPLDTREYINSILDSPEDALPFDEIIKSGNSVLIILSDTTRTTLSKVYLPVIIERLKQKGIADRDITLLCALGIHRKQTDDEHRALIGPTLSDRFSVIDHDPSERAAVDLLGTTRRGTPVALNRLLTNTDTIILTGSIRFHYFAGFSGGRKSILPGVSSFDACVANHLLVLNPQEEGGRNPLARPGILQGNPVHEDMADAARLVKNGFLFNTIVSPQGELLKAVSGDIHTAFQLGCRFLKEHFSIPLTEKADLIIASCGGHPWDLNFIQAHKTMDMASGVLKDGGVMILFAECSQGFGNPRFLGWFKNTTPDTFEAALRKNYEINGQTAYATFLKARKHHIIIVSSLKKDEVRSASMVPAHTIEEALEYACRILGTNPLTYILPEGSSNLPFLV